MSKSRIPLRVIHEMQIVLIQRLTATQQHKLTHETYENYLFLCRDGVVSRKRNLDAVREREQQMEEDKEREATSKRIRENTFQRFVDIPEITAWKALFDAEVSTGCAIKQWAWVLGLHLGCYRPVASLS